MRKSRERNKLITHHGKDEDACSRHCCKINANLKCTKVSRVVGCAVTAYILLIFQVTILLVNNIPSLNVFKHGTPG